MKVLQLSTHTTLAPRHGGQLRSHHIGRCLEIAGFDVSRVAVSWLTDDDVLDTREPIINLSQSEFWSSDVYRTGVAWMPYLHEYYFQTAVAETPLLLTQLIGQIASASPDVILLEHPWTWPLIKHLPSIKTGEVRVIYSSQNVETLLKRRMVGDAGVVVPGEVLEGIEELERDLVTSAWASVACTQADADVFLSWGARRAVVANNGTVTKDRETLLGALPMPLLPDQYFVFTVGSAYPPNISGFFTYVASALGRLRPNRRIVIAGGMCEPVDAQIRGSVIGKYAAGRLVGLGLIDDLTLDALIANASALLLPIEYGGGSNVKTAEALVSGRPIIATSKAFRGFTEYESLSRVTIADTPREFETAIHNALSIPPTRLVDVPLPRELLWEATLDPLIQLVQSLRETPARIKTCPS